MSASAMVALLAACGGGSANVNTNAGTGTLKLALTDSPACSLEHVYVSIEKIRVHQDSAAADADAGWSEILLTPARRVDLLTLTNGAVQELGATQLPSGQYAQMRLVLAPNSAGSSTLANAVQPAGAAELPLDVPSGQQSGFKVHGEFGVAAEQTADLVLDFDACNSVVRTGASGYQLKPVVSVMPRLASGIEGSVATTLPLSKTTVSAQQDGVAVRSTQPDERGNFSIPFLPPGIYTVVVNAEGHATGVVTGVPVDAGRTTVSTSESPVSLPASAMGEIRGDVSFSPVQDGVPAVTESSLLAVRALKVLSGGESIEVRSHPADGVNGNFSMKVPQAAPMKAPYAANGRPEFSVDLFETGRYSLDVRVR